MSHKTTDTIKKANIKTIKIDINFTPEEIAFFERLKKWEEDSTNTNFQVCGKIKE